MDRAQLKKWAGHYVPITVWLPAYDRSLLNRDLVAGLTGWGVMVPVAMAYAQLAGVPPEAGLYAAFAALAAYAVFGTSRHLKVTTSSTMAIMSASVVVGLAGGDTARYVALTAALALVVGVALIIGGIVRLGFISEFLSKPVLVGFIFGLAISIAVGQAPKLFGIKAGDGDTPQQLWHLIVSLGQTNLWTLAVGAGSLVLMVLLKRYVPRVPAGLVALVLGILAVTLFDLEAHGVSVVGPINTGFPVPKLPLVPLKDLPSLALGAAGIFFLAVGESVGTARAFATKYGYEIDPDQELIGLGAANVTAALFQGFTVDASLSQTATGESAGTRSQLSSLVTSLLILATAIIIAPLFKNLPNAVLGAIVIIAVISLMNVRELKRIYSARRTDFWLAMVALVGVITTGVLQGLAIAVLLSISLLLYHASRPYVAVLGRVPGHPRAYSDIGRHPENEPIPHLLILRLDVPLYFFNAEVARKEIRDLIAAREPRPRAVILDIGASGDIDLTAGDMLRELLNDLHAEHVDLLLAQARGPVRDRLRKGGLMGLIGEDHLYVSVATAVEEFSPDDLAGASS
jgi:SulP family sulfate permease